MMRHSVHAKPTPAPRRCRTHKSGFGKSLNSPQAGLEGLFGGAWLLCLKVNGYSKVIELGERFWVELPKLGLVSS